MQNQLLQQKQNNLNFIKDFYEYAKRNGTSNYSYNCVDFIWWEKIPELTKGLGSGIRNFKKAIKEDDNEEVAENKPTETDKKAEIPTQKRRDKNS